jgi:methionine--tRNA ligase beta chain
MESFLSGMPVAPEPVDPRGETVPNPPVKSLDELFDRVAEDIVDGANYEETPSKSQKKENKTPTAPSGEIDISQLDIRVGVITKAWEHPEADKLFCEEIDIGEESGPRQIASGLRAHYNVDDLVGQRVLVLANLKARKLVGFPSHGMVMCASNADGSKVEFVMPPADAAIGERIMVEGFEGEPVRFFRITMV